MFREIQLNLLKNIEITYNIYIIVFKGGGNMFNPKGYKKLAKLMDNLYICSGVKFALMADNSIEYYTSSFKTDFCSLIQQHPVGINKCKHCDKQYIDIMKKQKKAIVYRCHAGIIEVAVPVLEDGKVVSTILFGQILDDTHREVQWSRTEKLLSWVEDLTEFKNAFMRLKCLNSRQISAYQEIVDSCISEVRLSNIVEGLQTDDFVKLESFIQSHYAQDDILSKACSTLGWGKTKIYNMCKEHYQLSFGKVVLQKRLYEAANLICSTNLPIYYIAEIVGVKDFNYFTKLFKAQFGLSPRAYKKQQL